MNGHSSTCSISNSAATACCNQPQNHCLSPFVPHPRFPLTHHSSQRFLFTCAANHPLPRRASPPSTSSPNRQHAITPTAHITRGRHDTRMIHAHHTHDTRAPYAYPVGRTSFTQIGATARQPAQRRTTLAPAHRHTSITVSLPPPAIPPHPSPAPLLASLRSSPYISAAAPPPYQGRHVPSSASRRVPPPYPPPPMRRPPAAHAGRGPPGPAGRVLTRASGPEPWSTHATSYGILPHTPPPLVTRPRRRAAGPAPARHRGRGVGGGGKRPSRHRAGPPPSIRRPHESAPTCRHRTSQVSGPKCQLALLVPTQKAEVPTRKARMRAARQTAHTRDSGTGRPLQPRTSTTATPGTGKHGLYAAAAAHRRGRSLPGGFHAPAARAPSPPGRGLNALTAAVSGGSDVWHYMRQR